MKKQIAIVVGVVLVAVLAAAALFLLLDREPVIIEVEVEVPQSNRVVGGGSVVITEENFEEAMQESRTHAELFGHFMTEMNAIWTFPTPSSPSLDAYVANSEANMVPVFFEVELESTGEVVYTSPVMPVGSHIADLTLTAYLEPGEHPAVVTYYLLDDEEVYQASVSLTVTLVILDSE